MFPTYFLCSLVHRSRDLGCTCACVHACVCWHQQVSTVFALPLILDLVLKRNISSDTSCKQNAPLFCPTWHRYQLLAENGKIQGVNIKAHSYNGVTQSRSQSGQQWVLNVLNLWNVHTKFEHCNLQRAKFAGKFKVCGQTYRQTDRYIK